MAYKHSRIFSSATELLHELYPLPRLESQPGEPSWVFRGERDSRFDLVPSALRIDKGKTAATALSGNGFGGEQKSDHQTFFEFLLLQRFVEFCDEGTLPVPGDSFELRQEVLNFDKMNFKHLDRWPDRALLAPLAAAQHYGVPTRLLDWSRSPLVAAFFAAEWAGAGDSNSDAKYLRIWALDLNALNLHPAIEVVPMPGANNSQLGAQKGLFTLMRERGSRVDAPDPCDVAVYLSESCLPTPPLWELLLPTEHALELLYLCHLHGFDARVAYPGMKGAGLATLHHARWHATLDTGASVAADVNKGVLLRS